MIKICTNLPDMPESHEEFSELLLLYFPKTIDIKTIMTDKNLPKSGLQDLARSLNVERIGVQHQAGSDAKLTGDTFFNFFKVRTMLILIFFCFVFVLITLAVRLNKAVYFNNDQACHELE